jgi:hypothetical protein
MFDNYSMTAKPNQDIIISIKAVRVPLTTMPTELIKALTYEKLDGQWLVID